MTQATDSHIDPGCSWTTDPDMALGSCLGLVEIWVEELVTQVGMIVALTLGLYVTFGGSAGHGLQHRPQPQ